MKDFDGSYRTLRRVLKGDSSGLWRFVRVAGAGVIVCVG